MDVTRSPNPEDEKQDAPARPRHLRLASVTKTADLERRDLTASEIRFGRYVLLERIATGGMAEVFRARQDGPQGFSKTLVVKRILPHYKEDPDFLKMFLDEARLAALLEHPNLVSVQEAGTDPDYFIAMELLDGPNLLKLGRCASRDPQNLKIWARIIADACAGLDYAHELEDSSGAPLNIVHRDVSLENIVVTYDGRVKVLDFGIAKADCLDGRTAPGHVKGKFAYLAPEQFVGRNIDRRADVWALGVSLYRLASGVRPFAGRSMAEMVQRIVSQDPPLLHEVDKAVPIELSRIVQKALKKRPEQRYSTARELQDDLLAFVRNAGGSTSRDLAQFVERAVPREDRHRDRIESGSTSLPGQEPPMSEDIDLDWAAAESVSIVSAEVPQRTPAPPGRRLAAYVLELALGLVVLRYTYQSFFPAAFLAVLALSAASLARMRATFGERVCGLELLPNAQPRAYLARGLLRVGLQYGWLFLFAWFIQAAYQAHRFSDLIGISALGFFLSSVVGAIPGAFGERRAVHDLVTGMLVIQKKGC